MKRTTILGLGFFAVTLLFLIFLCGLSVSISGDYDEPIALDDTEDIRLQDFTAIDLTQDYADFDSATVNVCVSVTTDAERPCTLTAPRGFFRATVKDGTLTLQLTEHGRKVLSEGRTMMLNDVVEYEIRVTINANEKLNFISADKNKQVNLYGVRLNELSLSGTSAGLQYGIYRGSEISSLTFVTVSKMTNAELMAKHNSDVDKDNTYYQPCLLTISVSKVTDLSLNVSKGSTLNLTNTLGDITNVEVVGTGGVEGLRPNDYSSLTLRPDMEAGLDVELNGITKEVRL